MKKRKTSGTSEITQTTNVKQCNTAKTQTEQIQREEKVVPMVTKYVIHIIKSQMNSFACLAGSPALI